MDQALAELLRFLDEQRSRQAPHFPKLKVAQVLTFMGTTAAAGTHAAVGVHRLQGLQPAGERELHVRLGGAPPRQPAPGECAAVHLVRPEQFLGYQVKTGRLADAAAVARAVEPADGGFLVRAAEIYTVHHSPYTMKFFERIPHDEVLKTVGAVPCALVAVGVNANLSPRFVFHHEERLGRVALYHGDGLALKTYQNLKSNRQETRLALDLDTWSGFAMRGTVEEFQPHQHAEAYEKICAGFTAGAWGKPSRVFRFVADAWEPVGPV